MIEILPAIIPDGVEDLNEKVASVSYFTSIIHLDVLDGEWVPAKSWPYTKDMEAFTRIVNQEEGLPHWQTVDYEVHLMVNNPKDVIEKWVKAGARRIVIHAETAGNMEEVITMLKEKFEYTNDPEYGSFELGVALNLDTPIDVVAPYIEKIHFVQCMGISQVGYQGQPFDHAVLEKIKRLRTMYPTLPISGDGGLTLENAHEWVEAGATRLVSGSAVYQSENISETIEELRTLDEKIKKGLI